jgi:hypothetical protein
VQLGLEVLEDRTAPAVFNAGSDLVHNTINSAANGNSAASLGVFAPQAAASTTTTASNATVTFSSNAQNVTLNATVTSSGPVNEGNVTFTIKQGSTIIGTATTSGTVSNGQASVSYALPAGTAAGTYTIQAVYNPGIDFTGSSDSAHNLTVSAASTTTTADDATATFSGSAQNVTLTANVTSSAGPVNEGTVTFTILQGTTVIGTATTSTTVSNGQASVSYVLPAGTAAGTYTIDAVYNPGADFSGSSDNTHTLTISAGSTTTTADDATATFSGSAQNVTLTANVSSDAGPVNEGTVTFTILQGTTVIGTATTSDTVSNGAASVTYVLPAGTPSGSYTIDAVYNPGPHFTGSSDNTHTLTINPESNPASTTTTASDVTVPFSTSDQNVTLTANVSSDAGPVNEGTVTFTILQGTTVIGTATTSNTVSNGQASVSYVLPAGTAAGTYTIDAVYNPGPDFTGSEDSTHTLTVKTVAATTTTADDATATFSGSAQNVMLTANVSSDAGPVNEGTVTFTILQGTTVIGTATTSTTVSNGQASVSYVLPAGTAAGTYTIDAVYNPGADFSGSEDTAHMLTVSTASTTTTASDATVNFSSSDQNVTLTANVTSSAGPVNEGTVTFTILQGTTVIGTATTSTTVSNGVASVSYTLPAGTAADTYTIDAVYNPGADFSGSSDDTHTLTVKTVSATTTTANNATVSFSGSVQNVTLTANVSSDAGPVNEGTVTFTILQGSTIIGTATTSNTVSNGVASVSYALPASLIAGTYTINAVYNPGPDFTGSSDNTHTLTVNRASTTTTTSNATVTFSGSARNVTLTANVTSTAGPVNEGTVTFTILQGSTVIGTATTSTTVSNGHASVSYVLPAGTAAGTYTIQASYSDTFGNLAASSGQGSLAVSTAGTSLTVSTVNIVPNMLNMTAQVTLTVQVSTPAGAVGEGIVSVTLAGVSGQGNVVNGTASIQLTVPLLDVFGSPSVSLAYTDNTASASFASGRGSATLYLNIWSTLLSSVLTFAADASQHTQLPAAGPSLLDFSYSPSGLLSEISVGSLSLPVTYTNTSGGVLVTIAGVPWQVNFIGANGQHLGLATLAISADGTVEWLVLNSSGQVVGQMPL